MSNAEIDGFADILAQARRSGDRIETLPAVPSTVAAAHAIQDRVTTLLGEAVGGYKANTPAGEEPVRGLIYARMIRSSPARFSQAEVPHLGVEGEVAFRFTRDLPPREAPYSREEVAQSVNVLPAIEIVSSRLLDPRARPALEQLADNLINGGLAPGADVADWQQFDLPSLGVKFRVNGEVVVERQGGHPSGDPLHVAVALANMMRDTRGVTAGQIVTTGSWTGLRFLKPGDRCEVQFEHLGRAEVAFEA